MSPLKRTRRAADKQRARGSHAKPAPEKLRGGPLPLARESAVRLLLNPHTPSAQVPDELTDQDYDLPRLPLPDSRPLVTPTELLAALDDDEPTQPIEPVVLHYGNDFLLPVCEPGIGRPVTVTSDEDEVTCHVCRNWLEHVQPSTLDGLVLDEPHAGQQLAAMWREQLAQDFPAPLSGTVVDDEPQPARHAGLTPIPVPANPFLNAHPPKPKPTPAPRHAAPAGSEPDAPTQVIVRVGNALPARLTVPELMLLGRPVTTGAPPAPSPRHAPPPYRPIRRDARHSLVFSAFDAEFWETVNDAARQHEAGPGGLRMSVDAAMDALDAHLARLEAAHQAAIERVAASEYRGRLADASTPLPRRTPGASLTADASRGQLVTA